jgi:hypothetical protein
MSRERELERRLRALTGAKEAVAGERLQSLWGGYGELRRARLEGATLADVVVKCVEPPELPRARRDDAESRSHRRKLRSYEVELAFYRDYAKRCDARCRVPRAVALETRGGRSLFVLEDLDAAGFEGRRSSVSSDERSACLAWLAHFHATFVGVAPQGLWKTGTYWHLDTRPDELAALSDRELRAAAPAIDLGLKRATFRTFVHGDAKLENFCFGSAGVAAVDFQYVGGGPGIKDVAYFLSSALDARECEALAEGCLDRYFAELRAALELHAPEVDAAALEAEWRALFPLAWADFYRFLLGWAPGHYEDEAYSRRQVRAALDLLSSGRARGRGE